MISPTRKRGADITRDGSYSIDPKFPDVLFGKSYQSFMKSMNGNAEVTKARYRTRLNDFLVDHQSNTEAFYQWICDNENPDDERDTDALEELLTSYFNHLLVREDKQYKFATVLNFVKAVNHFLRGNRKDIGYSFKPSGLSVEEFNEKVVSHGAERMMREDVVHLMSLTTNPQYRAMMMILKDSGLRSGDVTNLQYKHVRKALQTPAPDFITFELMPQKNMGKSNLMANPVIGPDAIKYLRLWIEHKKALVAKREAYEIRMKRKGRYKGDPKPHYYSDGDEDYIWMYTETKVGYTNKLGRVVRPKNFGDRLSITGVTQAIQNLKRTGKIAEFKKKSAHSFRKAHTTGLTAGGVPERWINVMQGKKGEGTQGIYQRPVPEELIEAYAKGYPKIALAVEENKKITDLEDQVSILKEMVISTLAEKDPKAKWEALKHSLA